MVDETVQVSPPASSSRVSPDALMSGALDREKVSAFVRDAFSSVHELERLRDWVASPRATGVARGLALWAIGRNREALPLLAEQQKNPVIADILGRAHISLGEFDQAEKVLAQHLEDGTQAATYLESIATRGDSDRLQKELPKHEALLSEADRKYFAGRRAELDHDSLGAIAAYDEALELDSRHRAAMFRLALNVDLRGEDEEARELYERALLIPPVNLACVVNLGVLYEDMGNYRRAMQCFDLAMQSAPEDKRARLFRRDAAAALNMYYDEDQERREDKRNRILRTPINDFELSVRSRNCLAKMNIRTLGDLVRKTEAELLGYKNFGETSLTEIKDILRNKGLRLGMQPDELLGRELGEGIEIAPAPEESPDPESPDPAKRPVTELDLSVRSRRIVDLLKIKTIGDLVNKTEAELLACPNFGQTSLNEIKAKLDELGLALRG